MKKRQTSLVRRRLSVDVRVIVLCLAAFFTNSHGVRAQQSVAVGDSNDSLQEIIVTARKRDENLIETPVAVQYLSADSLQRAGTTDLAGLVEEVPQLHMATFFAGNGASMAIRGIGSPVADYGVESTVSLVFDGVQTSRGILSQLALFDVSNIQVLKGPQALFFGKNSPAGVVAVSSNGPTDTWQGYAHANYEFNAKEPVLELAAGGPITDTLKIRVSGKYDSMEGYVTNNATNQTYPNPFALAGLGAIIPGLPTTFTESGKRRTKNPDNRDLLGRIVLEWDPAPNFSAVLHVMAGRLTSEGGTEYWQTKCQTGPIPYELGLPVPTGSCNAGTSNSINYPAPPFVDGNLPFQDFTGTLDSLQLNYDAGKVTLSSITGYLHFNSHLYNTDDALLSLFSDASNESYRQLSEEFRIHSNFDTPVNFMGGLYYEDSTHPYTESVWVFAGLLPVNPTIGQYKSLQGNFYTTSKTYSPFAQASWKIRDDLTLDVGARYTHQAIDDTKYNSVTDPYLPILGLNPLPVGIVLSGSTTFTNTSPEATLSWHPHEETMLYAAYKTGYKSGGYSTPGDLIAPPTSTDADFLFKPEKSNGGEIGYKGLLLEHTLQITSAIYDYKFKNLQVSEFDSATLTFITGNAASATTKGVESDILWKAIPNLTLHANLTYNRGRYNSFANSPCYAGQTAGCTPTGTQNLSGARLPHSSDWTELAGFFWDQALGSHYRFTVGGNAQYLSPFNSSSTESSDANFGPIWLLGANLGIYSTDSSSWRVEVTGRNLLNEHYMTVTLDRTGASNAVGNPAVTDQQGPTNRPREIWLQLTKNFGK